MPPKKRQAKLSKNEPKSKKTKLDDSLDSSSTQKS
jgi:hypothetical protein